MEVAGKHPDLTLLAHRGYAACFPENTLEALEAAVKAGARHLEFDVQLTADRVPILLHDDSFMRTGGDPSRVLDIPYSKAATIRVGESGKFGDKYPDVCAPSLQAVVRYLQECPDVVAFVELKRHSLSQFGIGAVLDSVLPILQPILHRCVLISFVSEVLYEARARAGVPIGWALRDWNDKSRREAEKMAPEYLFCNVTRLPAAPEPLWQGSWVWVIYEIIDPVLAVELGKRGVEVIETMQIAEMHDALAGMSG